MAGTPAKSNLPAHAPLVCGPDVDGMSPTCPACVAEDRARSAVAAELARICRKFEDADRRVKRAASIPDREAAEAERLEAAGDFWAAGEGLADLLLLLFRYAAQHRPEALQMYLADALRPELAPIIDALVRLEARR